MNLDSYDILILEVKSKFSSGVFDFSEVKRVRDMPVRRAVIVDIIEQPHTEKCAFLACWMSGIPDTSQISLGSLTNIPRTLIKFDDWEIIAYALESSDRRNHSGFYASITTSQEEYWRTIELRAQELIYGIGREEKRRAQGKQPKFAWRERLTHRSPIQKLISKISSGRSAFYISSNSPIDKELQDIYNSKDDKSEEG